MNTYYNEVLRI